MNNGLMDSSAALATMPGRPLVKSTWDGKRLAQILEAAHVSKKELAELLDTSPANITRWVENVHEPMVTHLWKIADALGVEPDQLREDYGSPVKFVKKPDTKRIPRGRGRPKKPTE